MVKDDVVDLRGFSNTGVIDYHGAAPMMTAATLPVASFSYPHASETQVSGGKICLSINPLSTHAHVSANQNSWQNTTSAPCNPNQFSWRNTTSAPSIAPRAEAFDSKASIDDVANAFARRYMSVASDVKQEAVESSLDIHPHVDEALHQNKGMLTNLHEAALQNKEILTNAHEGLHNHKHALEMHNKKLGQHELKIKSLQRSIDTLHQKQKDAAKATSSMKTDIDKVATAQYRQSSCVNQIKSDHEAFKKDSYKVMMNHRDAIMSNAPCALNGQNLAQERKSRASR